MKRSDKAQISVTNTFSRCRHQKPLSMTSSSIQKSLRPGLTKDKKLKTRFVEIYIKAESVKSACTLKPEKGKMTVIIAKNYESRMIVHKRL